MKNIIKSVAVFSMIGMMQIGLGTSAIEASPLHIQSIQQQDDRHGHHDRQGREHVERERHGHEMRHRPHESNREWQERQNREIERHEENMRRIAHDVLDLILDD